MTQYFSTAEIIKRLQEKDLISEDVDAIADSLSKDTFLRNIILPETLQERWRASIERQQESATRDATVKDGETAEKAYAESVLWYSKIPEGKWLLLSALWQALGMDETERESLVEAGKERGDRPEGVEMARLGEIEKLAEKLARLCEEKLENPYSLMMVLAEKSRLQIGQLSAVLLGVEGGLQGLCDELKKGSGVSADQLLSGQDVQEKASERYNIRSELAEAMYQTWSKKPGEHARLMVWEKEPSLDDIKTRWQDMSFDMIKKYFDQSTQPNKLVLIEHFTRTKESGMLITQILNEAIGNQPALESSPILAWIRRRQEKKLREKLRRGLVNTMGWSAICDGDPDYFNSLVEPDERKMAEELICKHVYEKHQKIAGMFSDLNDHYKDALIKKLDRPQFPFWTFSYHFFYAVSVTACAVLLFVFPPSWPVFILVGGAIYASKALFTIYLEYQCRKRTAAIANIGCIVASKAEGFMKDEKVQKKDPMENEKVKKLADICLRKAKMRDRLIKILGFIHIAVSILFAIATTAFFGWQAGIGQPLYGKILINIPVVLVFGVLHGINICWSHCAQEDKCQSLKLHTLKRINQLSAKIKEFKAKVSVIFTQKSASAIKGRPEVDPHRPSPAGTDQEGPSRRNDTSERTPPGP